MEQVKEGVQGVSVENLLVEQRENGDGGEIV
jgi:hypothetical protein